MTIDPLLAEALASLGFVQLLYDWNWQDAEQSFKRSFELNPRYAPAYLFYGDQLVAETRFEEAIEQYQRALGLEPLTLIANAAVGMATTSPVVTIKRLSNAN